ncbi:MAG: MFS transporter [Solirubrobacterales bacterium]
MPSDQPSRARENLRLLADRNLGPFFLGNLVANSGTWLLVLAAGIFVYRRTGSVFMLGAVGFSQFAGVLLLVPWTGTAADRFDRRRLLFATQGAASLLAGTLAVLVMFDGASAALVIGFVFAIGLVQAFTFPALQAILPDLVPPDRLGSAIALMALTFNLARGIGPLTAALVIATAGLGEAFVVNALAYLALVAGLLAIRPQAPPRRPLRPRFRDSVALVRRRPRLAALMLVSSAAAIAIDPVNTLSPAFAASVWNRSDAFAGVLLGAFSVGALTAALTVAGRPGRLRSQLVARLSLLVSGMFAFSIAPTLELGLAALAVSGFGFLAASTTTIKELQLSIDAAQRGRIMALWTVAFLGVRPISSLVDGALASATSPRVSALAMAMPALVIVAILVVRGRSPPDRVPVEAHAAGEAGRPRLTAEG